MSSDLFLGVDGGGTKTAFVCLDRQGKVVAEAVTGTTYHLQVGLDGAVALLHRGVNEVCSQLGIKPADLRYSFFGLPAFGEDRVIDPQLILACAQIVGTPRYHCGNDMICGWAGSLGGEDGINLVAGTGSIGYGERRGKAERVGGWGEIFGDEGSAYWIAIQGLNAFTRMSDGRIPKGPLYSHLFQHLDLISDIDLCGRIMGTNGLTRDEIASLAPLVSLAASEGDLAAFGILEKAALELASMAITLRSALGFDDLEPALLSWSGGVLTHEPTARNELERLIDATGNFTRIEARYPPAIGAALYASKIASRG